MSGQDFDRFSVSYDFSVGPRPLEEILQSALAAQQAGDQTGAEAGYLEVLSRDPKQPDANNLLGVIRTHQGRHEEAVRLLETAVLARPGVASLYLNLGNAQMAAGDVRKAIACFERALSIETDAEGLNNLGFALASRGETDRALPLFRQALGLAPEEAGIHHNLALALKAGKHSAREAVEHYREALRLQPGMWQARLDLATLYLDLGRMEEGREQLERLLSFKPHLDHYSFYLVTMNYDRRFSTDDIRREALRWGERVTAELGPPPAKRFPPGAAGKAVLNIGYVSPDFRRHAAQYFIEPLLAAHDRSRFKVYCYANVSKPDAETERMRGYGHAWRDISRLSDAEAVEVIRRDGIDILVDLAGHTQGYKLPVFARRPAPVQITWFGIPATTGLPAMDYRFSDGIIDPEGEESRYTERVWRLGGFYACYGPDIHEPPRYPLPAGKNGHVTFVSMNGLRKVDLALVRTWAEILRRVEGARLLVKGAWADDEWVQESYLEVFRAAGVDSGRVEFEGWSSDLDDFHRLAARADIALDSYPFNGAITTFRAAAMGIPTVSLWGETAASRVGKSIAHHLGLDRLCAASEQEYVEIAVGLAADRSGLERLRDALPDRVRAAAGGDCRDFVAGVERAYREIWRLETG